jgi:hypothetical protein
MDKMSVEITLSNGQASSTIKQTEDLITIKADRITIEQ